ncbi:MAG: AtpZ/AtpI family protein [Thalassobaculum sp.]|jgi:ATP synthase protein I
MNDRNSPPSLENLADRVKRARGGEDRARRKSLDSGLPSSVMGLAFRVGVELVAGVVVGAAIGYGLDQWLGTTPWMLIVFFFLGAAGGMMNVYRAATGQGLSVGYAKSPDGEGANGVGPKGSDHSDGDSPDGGKKEG